MLICSWHSSLTSKSLITNPLYKLTNLVYRKNPAVLAAADKAFIAIAYALEAETIQGQTAQRIAGAAKNLIALAGIDANGILATLTPETQQTVQAYFS